MNGSGDPAFSDRRRGAALFIVLMFSALLAALAGAIMRTGVSAARAAAVFADVARADALGEAAGDIVIHELMTGDPEALRGGSLLVRIPDAEISIDYVSESARVDVNTASVELISALLSAAGADAPLIASVATRIATLRAAADKAGHEDPQTTSAGLTLPSFGARPPPQALYSTPLQIVEDWDLPHALAQRILPVLTVASGSKGVDPILADRLVLSALLGGDDTRVDDYMERRNQGFINAESALALLPVPSRPLVDFEDVPAVRAITHVTVARRVERAYDMVVASPAGSAKAPVVIGWRKLL